MATENLPGKPEPRESISRLSLLNAGRLGLGLAVGATILNPTAAAATDRPPLDEAVRIYEPTIEVPELSEMPFVRPSPESESVDETRQRVEERIVCPPDKADKLKGVGVPIGLGQERLPDTAEFAGRTYRITGEVCDLPTAEGFAALAEMWQGLVTNRHQDFVAGEGIIYTYTTNEADGSVSQHDIELRNPIRRVYANGSVLIAAQWLSPEMPGDQHTLELVAINAAYAHTDDPRGRHGIPVTGRVERVPVMSYSGGTPPFTLEVSRESVIGPFRLPDDSTPVAVATHYVSPAE